MSSSTTTPRTRLLEVKSFVTEGRYNIVISGHHDTIAKLDIPFRKDFPTVLDNAMRGKMVAE